MAPGPRFSTTTSAVFTMASNIARPRVAFRFSVTPFLLEFSSRKNQASSPFLSERARRPASPPGGSILMTSAPSQASICVLLGPASYCVRSRTRIPSRALGIESSSAASAALAWRVAERQHVTANALDLDHQHHALLGVGAHRERRARVLVRDGVHDLEVAIRPPLDDAPADLRLAVRVVHGDDRQRHARIALGVARLQRALAGGDQDAIALDADPHRRRLRRAVGQQRRQMGEVRLVQQGSHVWTQGHVVYAEKRTVCARALLSVITLTTAGLPDA